MLFNSIDFAIFLPLVFVLYWLVFNKSIQFQNILLLVASYVFYAWWDWRFLALIFLSTTVDFFVALGLKKSQQAARRKLLLGMSLSVNLGLLAFFKYYNFFLDNFLAAFTLLGTELRVSSLQIVLPVGVSFYTFQTLSYTIDVYRRKLEPSTDFLAFAGFVSFFPQLVAGPIERATRLLPQFCQQRQFHYQRAVDGLRQLLWGLFKKMVIADNCAEYADMIFHHSTHYSGSMLLLGAVCFAFQIYGDFSGYSDMAIGTARLFGFNLTQNFAFPYFSRSITEFWRRWHISLSTWFRDYLYIPLGGSKGGTWATSRNVTIVFLVSGFWHGANWTFIAWGGLHALFVLPRFWLGVNRQYTEEVAPGKRWPTALELVQMLSTFLLVTLAWVFFRAESIAHAWAYLNSLFRGLLVPANFEIAAEFLARRSSLMFGLLMVFFLLVEWRAQTCRHGLEWMASYRSALGRYAIYLLLVIAILAFAGKTQTFIYFQF